MALTNQRAARAWLCKAVGRGVAVLSVAMLYVGLVVAFVPSMDLVLVVKNVAEQLRTSA